MSDLEINVPQKHSVDYLHTVAKTTIASN